MIIGAGFAGAFKFGDCFTIRHAARLRVEYFESIGNFFLGNGDLVSMIGVMRREGNLRPASRQPFLNVLLHLLVRRPFTILQEYEETEVKEK